MPRQHVGGGLPPRPRVSYEGIQADSRNRDEGIDFDDPDTIQHCLKRGQICANFATKLSLATATNAQNLDELHFQRGTIW